MSDLYSCVLFNCNAMMFDTKSELNFDNSQKVLSILSYLLLYPHYFIHMTAHEVEVYFPSTARIHGLNGAGYTVTWVSFSKYVANSHLRPESQGLGKEGENWVYCTVPLQSTPTPLLLRNDNITDCLQLLTKPNAKTLLTAVDDHFFNSNYRVLMT